MSGSADASAVQAHQQQLASFASSLSVSEQSALLLSDASSIARPSEEIDKLKVSHDCLLSPMSSCPGVFLLRLSTAELSLFVETSSAVEGEMRGG
jgi:hypothetical protein